MNNSKHELELVAPGLYCWRSRLTGPQQPVNSYVLAARDGCWALVIDPAADIDAGKVSQAVGKISDVLVTHVQRENIEGWSKFPGAAVHVPKGDEYLCDGEEAYRKLITPWPDPWEWETRGNFQGHMSGAMNERPPIEPVPLGASIEPGKRICGFDVLSTPGHGKHSVTLLTKLNGRATAFCGDVAYEGGRMWNWFDCEWDYGSQHGQAAALASVRRLIDANADCLCPTHGPIIGNPKVDLQKLNELLSDAIEPKNVEPFDYATVAVEEVPSPVKGFRILLPHLHQYTVNCGNCSVLLSESGDALLVDDGLCCWRPLEERAENHRRVIADLKKTLNIRRIEIVIPTHYHGDHIENIPELVAMEKTKVIAQEAVASAIQHPERFNLAASLPWYGTRYFNIDVDQAMPDRAVMKWKEYELEFFRLGGQTFHAGGLSTIVDGQRVVFAGDSMGWQVPLCYNDSEPVERGSLYSVQQLLARRPQLLVGGHGWVNKNPMPLLEHQLRLAKRMVETYRALSAHDDLRKFFDPFI